MEYTVHLHSGALLIYTESLRMLKRLKYKLNVIVPATRHVDSKFDSCRTLLCHPLLILSLTLGILGPLVMSIILQRPSAEYVVQPHQFVYFETQTLNDSKMETQTINLKQFGFKLLFLPNTSLEPVSFTIGIAGLLPFTIIPPANTSLISALYYIKTSSELLQPVIVEIQHCVNATNASGLTFAKTTVQSDRSSPYIFTKLSGGRFHRKYWGAIKLSNFSFVGIFNEGENNYSSIDYLAHISRLRRNGESGVYQVALTASLNLNVYKEVNQKIYVLDC